MTKHITEDVDNARKLLANANELARKFYRVLGYERPEGYRFDKAAHSLECCCWLMAKIAFESLTFTDLDDVADEAEELTP